jgi:hypothetical protein
VVIDDNDVRLVDAAGLQDQRNALSDDENNVGDDGEGQGDLARQNEDAGFVADQG